MTKLDALRVTDSPFKRRYGNFIAGQWVEPASGQTFEEAAAARQEASGTHCELETPHYAQSIANFAKARAAEAAAA